MKITPKEGVVSQLMDDEYVLLDMSTNQYFGLSKVSARFWQLIMDGENYESVHTHILAEFDVNSDRLHTDLQALISQLDEAGLIIVDD